METTGRWQAVWSRDDRSTPESLKGVAAKNAKGFGLSSESRGAETDKIIKWQNDGFSISSRHAERFEISKRNTGPKRGTTNGREFTRIRSNEVDSLFEESIPQLLPTRIRPTALLACSCDLRPPEPFAANPWSPVGRCRRRMQDCPLLRATTSGSN